MPPERDGTEPDRVLDAPHPRERSILIGQREAETAFLDAFRADRLHHAWLIGGPRGIGKATLAYRIAKFLFANGAGSPARAASDLAVDPGHRAARQVAALSHPDLAVLRRITLPDKKGPTTTIPVEAVRRALGLFTSTSAGSGYRICIVDSAEDLGAPGANALLKLIEEPPLHSLFLIVSHRPQRVLPTIRSRCRRLALKPLSAPDLATAVRSLGSPYDAMSDDALARATALAEGSVGRAVEYLDEGTIAALTEVDDLLANLSRVDPRRVLALGERIAGRSGAGLLEAVLDAVLRFVSRQIRADAGEGPERLAALAEVCDNVARAAREAETFNLDRRPLVLALFGELATAVQGTRG